jgi:SAM-dependent methyltransferase
MYIDQGIPTIDSYRELLKSNLFRSMETFSSQFLKKNKIALQEYRRNWVADPLHQWSRQYEYPFVYFHVRDYINNQQKSDLKILDAGSGVTFFPYYLCSNSPKIKVYCCDYDLTHGQIFDNINKNLNLPNNFFPADIRRLPFGTSTFDIVYCISVLEHTDDYDIIIQEFKRILRPNGLFIVTFDISIDGIDDIPREKAVELIESLEKHFFCTNGFNSKQDLDLIDSEKILTTRYIRELDKNLLPWKYSCSNALKDLLRFRAPKRFFTNLTCFCQALSKQKW